MFVPLLLGNAHILRDPQHVNCPFAETRMITCIDERGMVTALYIYVIF